MELATPLQHTILSLADDELLLPTLPPTITSMIVEPSEVPLPTSPDELEVDAPLISFSPPPADPQYPQTSTPLRPSPPLHSDSARIPADLLTRVESMSQARVDAIEREVEDKAGTIAVPGHPKTRNTLCLQRADDVACDPVSMLEVVFLVPGFPVE